MIEDYKTQKEIVAGQLEQQTDIDTLPLTSERFPGKSSWNDRQSITSGSGETTTFFVRGELGRVQYDVTSSNSVKVETIKDVPLVPGGGDSLVEESDNQKRILLDSSICGSCQNCIRICPHDIWTVSDSVQNMTTIDASKIGACTMDNECIRVCPTGAIEIIPKG